MWARPHDIVVSMYVCVSDFFDTKTNSPVFCSFCLACQSSSRERYVCSTLGETARSIVTWLESEVLVFTRMISLLDEPLCRSFCLLFGTGPLAEGDSFSFKSLISDGQRSAADPPRGLQLIMEATNANGEKVINSFLITYTNDCAVFPVLTEGQLAGWVVFVRAANMVSSLFSRLAICLFLFLNDLLNRRTWSTLPTRFVRCQRPPLHRCPPFWSAKLLCPLCRPAVLPCLRSLSRRPRCQSRIVPSFLYPMRQLPHPLVQLYRCHRNLRRPPWRPCRVGPFPHIVRP
jgi:hypothetical protein